VTDGVAGRDNEALLLTDTVREPGLLGDTLAERDRVTDGVAGRDRETLLLAVTEREPDLVRDTLAVRDRETEGDAGRDAETLLLAVRDADTVGVMPAALWPMRRTRWQPGSAAYSAPVTGSMAKPPLAAHIRKEADVPMPSAQPAAPLPAYVLTSREPVSTRRMTALPASATNRLPAALSASA
jgi:hypothetical protein